MTKVVSGKKNTARNENIKRKYTFQYEYQEQKSGDGKKKTS